MPAIQAAPKRIPNLSTDLAAVIWPAKKGAARPRRRVGRFEIYDVLKEIYRIYVGWQRLKIAKKSAHAVADGLNLSWRKGMSPIRVLINAVKPDADFKQRSRWVRAMEYIYSLS